MLLEQKLQCLHHGVMIRQNKQLKLIDFGCSKYFVQKNKKKKKLSGIIGTSIYCSPEVIDNLYDVTHTYRGLRGDEIKDWLDEHSDVENYVIIDDDGDMRDDQLYHFVQTNFEDGLTEVETNRAIKVLNKKYFQNSMALNFTLRHEHLKFCEGLPHRCEELAKYNDLCKDGDNR